MKKLLCSVLLLLSSAVQADLSDKEVIYAKLLSSSNLQNIKLGAKGLHHDLPANTQLWDFAAYTLWSMNKNGNKSHDEFDDTIAWLAKAIGESKQARYQTLLKEQLQFAQSNKVRKYFKGALKDLNKNEVAQFNAELYVPQELPLDTVNIATGEKFATINSGDTLQSVLSLLGQPDGVGQYIRSYRRPFIGRQTFQNLRLSYINLGSMEFRYDETQWVVDLKSEQTNADISGVKTEYRDLVSRLVSNDVTQIRAAAREAIKLPLTDPESLDHIAQYIWDNQNTDDKQFADSLAWLCKVLSNSKNGRYKEMLSTLAQKPIHKKIVRYSANAAKNLPSSTTHFTPAIKAQTAVNVTAETAL